MPQNNLQSNTKQPVWYAYVVTFLCATSMMNMVLSPDGVVKWAVASALALGLVTLLLITQIRIRKNKAKLR